jgi:hypothetical protein
MPIEAEIHKRQISFLHNILNCNNDNIRALTDRQLIMNINNPQSFFCRSSATLEMYNLHNSLGSTYASYIRNATLGFIPFEPCNPVFMRQLIMNINNPQSFFCRSSATLEMYNLPTITELKTNLPLHIYVMLHLDLFR